MDDDIRENLQEVGKWLEAVSRQISSKKSSMESISAMRDCCLDGARILETYLRIQRNRY